MKEVPFPEVFQRFYGGKVRRNKAFSPFREEKIPSFHIYPDGWKDYGTGEYGDSIDFVARLLNISPLEAARAIAREFGIPIENRPLSREDRLRIARVKADRLREKQLRDGFENWTRLAGEQVRILAEAIRLIIEEKGLDINDDLLPLVHKLPLFEYWADILAEGTLEEKVMLFRNSDFRGWFCGGIV